MRTMLNTVPKRGSLGVKHWKISSHIYHFELNLPASTCHTAALRAPTTSNIFEHGRWLITFARYQRCVAVRMWHVWCDEFGSPRTMSYTEILNGIKLTWTSEKPYTVQSILCRLIQNKCTWNNFVFDKLRSEVLSTHVHSNNIHSDQTRFI